LGDYKLWSTDIRRMDILYVDCSIDNPRTDWCQWFCTKTIRY
jgi:hypothetical protein